VGGGGVVGLLGVVGKGVGKSGLPGRQGWPGHVQRASDWAMKGVGGPVMWGSRGWPMIKLASDREASSVGVLRVLQSQC